ncbi:MAG: class I SAM-dependent methyltransferase [Gemmatimonadetes bacterium]|nr:MAG: class I SAM-dependent methyltransferase [Gemmatimonadota bacterium]
MTPLTHFDLVVLGLSVIFALFNPEGMMKKAFKTTFDEIPALYDEVRPTYPAPLIEDIITLSNLRDNASIVEIGCGTGQATTPFLERGYSVLAVELGQHLAEFTRQKFANYAHFAVEVASFEAWQPPDSQFDLLIAGQVFHWIEPELGLNKAASILKPNGSIALFWNTDVSWETPFYHATNAIYERFYVERPKAQKPGTGSDLYAEHLAQHPDFIKFQTRIYPWQETYTKERYFKLLDTFSPHRVLEPEVRHQFYDELAQVVDQFGGNVTRFYEAVLLIAKRKD